MTSGHTQSICDNYASNITVCPEKVRHLYELDKTHVSFLMLTYARHYVKA